MYGRTRSVSPALGSIIVLCTVLPMCCSIDCPPTWNSVRTREKQLEQALAKLAGENWQVRPILSRYYYYMPMPHLPHTVRARHRHLVGVHSARNHGHNGPWPTAISARRRPPRTRCITDTSVGRGHACTDRTDTSAYFGDGTKDGRAGRQVEKDGRAGRGTGDKVRRVEETDISNQGDCMTSMWFSYYLHVHLVY